MPSQSPLFDRPDQTNGIVISSLPKSPEWQSRATTPTSSIASPPPAYTAAPDDIELLASNTTTMASWAMKDKSIATKHSLQLIQDAVPLPPKAASSWYRTLRWNFFSVYRKLFTLILLGNMAAIVVFFLHLRSKDQVCTYHNAATAAAANFCVAVMMRHEHVVNILFKVVCLMPVWFPLSLRRRAAKIYSHGGVHSACGLSGTVWYFIFAGLAIDQYSAGNFAQAALAVTTGLTLFLLVVILIFAHPTIRAKLHNHFETTHRYGGWSAIITLWLQTLLLIIDAAGQNKENVGIALLRAPTFWFLSIITAILVYPWTRLRKRSFKAEKLSKHATRLHFDYTSLSSCRAIRLTDSPLTETHSFATIPHYKEDGKGFTVLISNAGDWTSKIINNPPKAIWVKGAPTIGVMRVALMFKKVLVVATGSGIGPCLSLLQAYPDFPMRVLWSAPNPQSTFGDTIINSVLRSDPDAVIVDSKKTGRPDLVALSYSMFIESGCEAAIVISNPAVTRKVVYGLETRGLPAYGPIFDS